MIQSACAAPRRGASLTEEYYNVYNVRKDDMSHYDLVLDTTSLSPEEVKEKILTEYFKWLKNH